MSEVTRLLERMQEGEAGGTAELFPLVYAELRRLAARQVAGEAVDQSLGATGLVHEAYLKLTGSPTPRSFANRGHFFAAAAEAMRRILVDRARQRKAQKRGGGNRRLDFEALHLEAERTPAEFLLLHEALDRLETMDKRKADLVKLRFFAGLSNQQAAEALGVSVSTADNDWAYARAWLRLEIE